MRSKSFASAAVLAVMMAMIMVGIVLPGTTTASPTSITNMFKNLKSRFVKKINQLTLSDTGDCQVSGTITMTMEQHELPSSVSEVTTAITSKVEEGEEGVSVLKAYWKEGEEVLKSKSVGTYEVKVIVKQADTKDKKCITVPFEVADTNECTLPEDHEWANKCSPTAKCINTRESYECLCPLATLDGQDRNTLLMKQLSGWQAEESKSFKEGSDDDEESKLDEKWSAIVGSAKSRFYWELNLPIEYVTTADENSPCKGTEASTKFCCAGLDPHSVDGQNCRSNFVCPVNPCDSTEAPSSLNVSSDIIMSYKCVPEASCATLTRPWDKPYNYMCACPEGTVGSGRPCNGESPPAPDEGECGCTPVEPEPTEEETAEEEAKEEESSTGDEL